MKEKIRHTVFPLLAAFIWGTAFVFQRESTEYIQPLTFNALRAAIAAITLIFVSLGFEKTAHSKEKNQGKSGKPHDLIIGGICCGTLLTLAANLQQFGLVETSAGKAGFITALYIVIVPILGLFVNKKTTITVWIGVFIAVIGLYCLCIKNDFTFAVSDFYILLCAIVFAVHIMVIDHFSQRVDGIKLSCAQFAVMTVISGSGAFIFENPSFDSIMQCIWSVLYVGIFSSGVAYTLQIIAQKDANPTAVSLLLSLESVFSVLAGAVMLNEVLTKREYIGCVLMLTAVIFAQLPTSSKNEKVRQTEIL